MAPLEPQQPPRKKWTRAKAPRVRTGCKTCKIRHLKCDEQKPVCQRCQKDRQKCDGYEDPKAPVVKAKKPLKLVQYQSKPKLPDCRALSALRPALSIENLGSPSDAALFYHARECTIMDFDVLSGSLFWRNFVLPLAHTVEPVKHALCALGGAHRRFVAGYQGDATSSSLATEFEYASIQKYNQAILHMKPLMEDNSEMNLQTTLICCVIFICIESLHGRYTESIRHLKAGCQLLNSFRAEMKFGNVPSSLFQPTNGKEAEYSLFDLVTEMFYRLGQNVAIYVGSDTFHDLVLPFRAGHMGDPKTPFSDLVEAAFYLERVDEFYDKTYIEFVAGPQPIRPLETSCMGITGWEFDYQAGKAALNASRRAFAVWDARYELTKREERYAEPSPEEKSAFASLDMHQAVWQALVKFETIEQVIPKDDGEKILKRAEVLVEIENRRPTPVFAFNGYLIPLLSLVCTYCEDVDTQFRAISLLRAVRRREGIWDSQEVAGIYETMIIARKQNMVSWENLPWGIPQLAAELSSLNLSDSCGSTPSSTGSSC
ncbi:Hypothetical protein NCS54_01007400 [Fusarium falciforme]|uniref:Hypothetical protein n=1 Tax=Fusarium falciforme TaxID=195108 RepID=UPI002301DF59|nr:Hypothetical protein NCS54_01007400 [Fusarium falciforme]WAO92560.1 Hypothetical protein NCS54_01007400 [Fusarium falciforme]